MHPTLGLVGWALLTFAAAALGAIASADASVFYDKWMADRAFLLVPAQAIVAEFIKTFEEFPPRQKPASFSIDHVMEKMTSHDAKLSEEEEESPRRREPLATESVPRSKRLHEERSKR